MPTYDYACEACGHRFEHLQSITEKALKKCPECGRAKLRRLIGAGAGFIFKGSGFYITDYGKDGKGPRKESGGESEAPKADKPEAATAPAPKAEKAETAPVEKKTSKKTKAKE